MKPLLVLNCAEDRLQLVLGHADALRGPRLLAAQEWTAPGKANPLLAPSVQGMLQAFALTPGDLAGVACVAGPGSFTGVRMSLAFAEGLRLAAGLPLAGLAYLDLLARSAWERMHLAQIQAQTPLLVCTHARRGLCYAQLFPAPSTGASPSAIMVLPIAEALQLAATSPTFLLGSALRPTCLPPLELTAFLEAHPHCILLPDRFDHPDAATLLAAAVDAEYGQAPLAPIYLRPSDAEANLEAIALAKGMDPVLARQTLTRLTSADF